MLECSFEVPYTNRMITIKVTLSNGNNWTTGFNGTLKDAEGYYLGTFFETSDDLHDHECVRVELAGGSI